MIFVLCGPGGVGKGTVASRLVERVAGLDLSRSWTTRPRRPGEPSDAYVFSQQPAFEEAIALGRFVEWAEFLGNYYGTPVPDERYLGCESHLLLEIDLQGARQIKDLVPASVVFVLQPPDLGELKKRLEGRGDDESHAEARLAMASSEIDGALELGGVPVVNDDLDTAVAAIAALIEAKIADCG